MEQEALAALERVLPDAPQYVSRKQLEILPASQWYLTGGVFDAAKSFKNWAARGRAAEANGFVGARTTGNPFWLDSEEDWHQFLTYDQAVHQTCDFLVYVSRGHLLSQRHDRNFCLAPCHFNAPRGQHVAVSRCSFSTRYGLSQRKEGLSESIGGEGRIRTYGPGGRTAAIRLLRLQPLSHLSA